MDACHRKRNAGRFVVVSCGAIPTGLIESELFGDEKGAFTGAAQRRIGRFEAAQGGTLFLDEVGDLATETQVRLLRVLQERSIERLGSDRVVRLDVRVIAATHVDLEKAVEAGKFREDFYYRLNVVSIAVPPLRERREDIQELAEAFLAKVSGRLEIARASLTEEARNVLVKDSWPGNVRALETRARARNHIGAGLGREARQSGRSIWSAPIPECGRTRSTACRSARASTHRCGAWRDGSSRGR